MAKIRDDNLFRQPERSNYGECPICCLPLPLDVDKYVITACCCKIICKGCDYATQLREWEEGLEHKCSFCREPVPATSLLQESEDMVMKRVEADDPNALCFIGRERRDLGDYEGAFEYLTKAAVLGNAEAHNTLGCFYGDGLGVDKDMKKAIYHWEEAAIGGHELARYNLEYYERRRGRIDRAIKHRIIAAKLGDNGALMEAVKCLILVTVIGSLFGYVLFGMNPIRAAVDLIIGMFCTWALLPWIFYRASNIRSYLRKKNR